MNSRANVALQNILLHLYFKVKFSVHKKSIFDPYLAVIVTMKSLDFHVHQKSFKFSRSFLMNSLFMGKQEVIRGFLY